MPEPITTILAAGAAGAATGKFVEKAWDSGERWIRAFFRDHQGKLIEKAADNSKAFLNELAAKVARLEESQQVDRAVIDRALEEPNFGALLQKALIGSAQTASDEKHDILASLVTNRLLASD